MQIKLKLNMPDAVQEAVWLNDFINEHDIDGMDSSVIEAEPERGTMDGGTLTAALMLVLYSEAIKQTIGSLFDAIFHHFDGKDADFELSGECPDSGKKFSIKYEKASYKKRKEAQLEFDVLYATMCT